MRRGRYPPYLFAYRSTCFIFFGRHTAKRRGFAYNHNPSFLLDLPCAFVNCIIQWLMGVYDSVWYVCYLFLSKGYVAFVVDTVLDVQVPECDCWRQLQSAGADPLADNLLWCLCRSQHSAFPACCLPGYPVQPQVASSSGPLFLGTYSFWSARGAHACFVAVVVCMACMDRIALKKIPFEVLHILVMHTHFPHTRICTLLQCMVSNKVNG